MDLGLHYWNFSIPSDPAGIAATLTSAAEIAEQEGLAEFSVVDHFFQMEHVALADQPISLVANRFIQQGRRRDGIN
jgi:hypothetical protein